MRQKDIFWSPSFLHKDLGKLPGPWAIQNKSRMRQREGDGWRECGWWWSSYIVMVTIAGVQEGVCVRLKWNTGSKWSTDIVIFIYRSFTYVRLDVILRKGLVLLITTATGHLLSFGLKSFSQAGDIDAFSTKPDVIKYANSPWCERVAMFRIASLCSMLIMNGKPQTHL